MALSAADEPEATQAWARAIYSEYGHLHGLVYPSAMRGKPSHVMPAGVHPDFVCHDVALFERARPSLPTRPRLHLPLNHPGLAAVLGELAVEYGYDMT